MEDCCHSEDERPCCCCVKRFEEGEDGGCVACGDENVGVALPWKCVAATVVGARASVASAPILLAAAGFSATGITAGSLAATYQATMGGIGAGGLFAIMQTAAMAALGTGGSLTLAGSTGTAILIFCEAVDKLCNGCIGGF
eukprot:TRINITY_DN9599_c0_g1_i1.p2 TRINITY_DN9599_c0_g1~~TRINITY_DN9599_c0_g1_i1.p2  ORF type:complete len:141 (-),score=28.30 TRINITY_DN9599_c0_g1_i1:124-546(-)